MKLVIYLFPVMINFIASGVFFYVTQRFVDAEASKMLTAMVIPTWAITYCISNIIIGKIVTPKNAARLIVYGGMIIAASALGFIFLNQMLLLLLAWTGLLGIGFGFYCSSFQVWCRELEQNSASGIAMATGKYTMAWSLGFASGALTFGMLNAAIAFSICFAVGVLVAAGVALIDLYLKKHPIAPATHSAPDVPSAADAIVSRFPDYAWVGWIVGGIVSLAVNQLRSMLQPHGAAIGIANLKETMAITLMTVSLVQGLTALFLVKSRIWMYKLLPLILIALTGAVSMACFCFVRSLPWFLITAVIYGIYSGCGYFIFVFYALANREKAGRNAAINEVSVSVVSIAGPMLGGLLVDMTGISWTPFVMASGMIILATIFHTIVFSSDKRRKIALNEVK
ncbi:MAG: hypothetical protein J6R86_06000 [Lentisphaeria bacterium]|nr:hypothetical protein [Lentisphaeria bacterium]